MEQAVLDTNVMAAALRSNAGASYRLIRLIGRGKFDMHVSVGLVLEYEEVLKRMAPQLGLDEDDIEDFIDYVCSVAIHHQINFLWRPFLRDADDDMVLEVAANAGCEWIVTHNVVDFEGVETLGIGAIRPGAFLRKLGVKS